MSDTTTDAAADDDRKNPTWLVATVAGAFGLFYAYAVWNALGNLVQDPRLNHRLAVTAGVLQEESAALLRGFFSSLRKRS